MWGMITTVCACSNLGNAGMVHVSSKLDGRLEIRTSLGRVALNILHAILSFGQAAVTHSDNGKDR